VAVSGQNIYLLKFHTNLENMQVCLIQFSQHHALAPVCPERITYSELNHDQSNRISKRHLDLFGAKYEMGYFNNRVTGQTKIVYANTYDL
jgi:hypothetical protein